MTQIHKPESKDSEVYKIVKARIEAAEKLFFEESTKIFLDPNTIILGDTSA